MEYERERERERGGERGGGGGERDQLTGQTNNLVEWDKHAN